MFMRKYKFFLLNNVGIIILIEKQLRISLLLKKKSHLFSYIFLIIWWDYFLFTFFFYFVVHKTKIHYLFINKLLCLCLVKKKSIDWCCKRHQNYCSLCWLMVLGGSINWCWCPLVSHIFNNKKRCSCPGNSHCKSSCNKDNRNG